MKIVCVQTSQSRFLQQLRFSQKSQAVTFLNLLLRGNERNKQVVNSKILFEDKIALIYNISVLAGWMYIGYNLFNVVLSHITSPGNTRDIQDLGLIVMIIMFYSLLEPLLALFKITKNHFFTCLSKFCLVIFF